MPYNASREGVDVTIPTSLDILRERGPMTLRKLSGATAKARGHSVRYRDLDGLLHGYLERGEVTHERADDWRNDVWAATGLPSARTSAEAQSTDCPRHRASNGSTEP